MKKYILIKWTLVKAYTVIDISKDDSMSFHSIEFGHLISHDHFSYEDYDLGPIVAMSDDKNEIDKIIEELHIKEGNKFHIFN